MFCTNCGHDAGDSNFCPNCGFDLLKWKTNVSSNDSKQSEGCAVQKTNNQNDIINSSSLIAGTGLKYGKNGHVFINGTKYGASDLKYDLEEGKKIKKLTITTRGENGTVVYVFTAEKKLVGFGAIGDAIQEFKEKYPALVEENRAFKALVSSVVKVKMGNIPKIQTPDDFLLTKNEFASIFENKVEYYQQKVKRSYAGTSASVRVVKGVSVRVGGATPIEYEQRVKVDEGKLLLTNKRLIFVGRNKSVVIPIRKIVNVEKYTDGLAIVKDDTTTKLYFIGFHGLIWAETINALSNEE